MSLYSQVAGPTKAFLRQLKADKNLSRPVIYKQYVKTDFDAVKGHNVTTWKEFSITATKLLHNQRTVNASNSKIEVGDSLFLFAGEDIPTSITLKDQIVDEDGVKYRLKGIDNIFGIAVSITVDGWK